jgi:putative PIG3 family NAD(P)H quinone oxidoreductase
VRYVAYERPGDPAVLHVAEGPAPEITPSDVLVSVEAAGVSRADALQRRGLYPPPRGASPILGLEVAGTVVETGAHAGEWRVGDRVCALTNGGGYAELVAVPQGQVLPIPDGWTPVEAASLPENAFTVYDNVFTRARLRPGETLLVHGGTSGIGTTAIAFARAFGARVFATAGSEEKRAAILRLGADAAINYRTADFVAECMRLTAGRGVDVILDIVGGDYIDRDLDAIAMDGRIACLASAGGSDVRIDLRKLLVRRAAIMGSSLRARTSEEKAAIARGLRENVWPLLAKRDHIAPAVDSVYPFEKAADAHARLESSAHVGKIVLVPN